MPPYVAWLPLPDQSFNNLRCKIVIPVLILDLCVFIRSIKVPCSKAALRALELVYQPPGNCARGGVETLLDPQTHAAR